MERAEEGSASADVRIVTNNKYGDVKMTVQVYIPDSYGECRTKGTIPPSAIQNVDLTDAPLLSDAMHAQMEEACSLVQDKGGRDEVVRGFSRFSELGLTNLPSLPEEGNGMYPRDDPKSFEDAINSLPWDEPKQSR